jgi:hypothetical protein
MAQFHALGGIEIVAGSPYRMCCFSGSSLTPTYPTRSFELPIFHFFYLVKTNFMKNAPRIPFTIHDTARIRLAFTRSALALIRPDFVTDYDRIRDAAILSDLASQINEYAEPCRKED